MTFNSYLGGFAYQYSLVIDGKPYKTFLDQQSKIMKTWILPVDGEMCRVVLEKDTLDIWVNGKKVEVAAEFTDDGIHTLEWPALWRITMNSLHNEGIYK